VFKGNQVIAQYYVPHHGTGSHSHVVTLGIWDQLPGTYYMEVTTCNQVRNPWFNGCVFGGGATVYLQP
jgi:hypothetical protein